MDIPAPTLSGIFSRLFREPRVCLLCGGELDDGACAVCAKDRELTAPCSMCGRDNGASWWELSGGDTWGCMSCVADLVLRRLGDEK